MACRICYVWKQMDLRQVSLNSENQLRYMYKSYRTLSDKSSECLQSTFVYVRTCTCTCI